MNPNNLFGSIQFNDLILWILGLATLVGVAEANGFLPRRLAKWLVRNRLENTLNALQRLGVRVSWDEDKGSISITDQILDSVGVKELAYKIELKRLLQEDSFQGSMEIGATRTFSQDQFIDVMGATTDHRRAEKYARLLHTHLEKESLPAFDVVATPRTGSPLLGYEFARLGRKPFVMGVFDKVHDKTGAMKNHASLDFSRDLDLNGKRVLIVDDSTTGGRKQLDLANALRSAGASVESSLVLFEPQGKGAREKLEGERIKLYAVQSGPAGTF